MATTTVSEGSTMPSTILGNGIPNPGWMVDPNSTLITRRYKPHGYFRLLNRGTQCCAMKEIHKLYKTAGDNNWEEKWIQVEVTMRLKRPEIFTEMDRDNSRVERLTDPNIFAG
jgi:hypothetical protein